MQEKISCPVLGAWAESATQLALVPLSQGLLLGSWRGELEMKQSQNSKGSFPQTSLVDTSLGSSLIGFVTGRCVGGGEMGWHCGRG